MPDEVTPAEKVKFCPFMPPLIMPGKLAGDVSIRPVPCLGEACAARALCQVLPETMRKLKDLTALIEERA